MKACVVGGRGFLGKRIVSALSRDGLDVLSLDVTPQAEETRANVRQGRLDVTDYESAIAALAAERPDIVIHLPFMRENLPRPAFRLNVLGFDNVLEAARICEVGRVVYCSSIAVHGGQENYGERPITEEDRPAPRKQYDHHKVFNEWQAKEYREKHGMSVIGIRATNVGGSDKLIGSVEHVLAVVRPALGENLVLDYPDRMRCCIHGDDAAEAFRLVALAPAPEHAIYNTGGDAMSICEIAAIVRRHIPEADITFRHESGGKAVSGAWLFSNARLVGEFGFSYRPWAEVIPAMIENVRRRARGG